MGIVLRKLVARGPNLVDADVGFDVPVQIIQGPSETGKSYIFSCLWYMLGGNELPKAIPPYGQGYDQLLLEIEDDSGQVYTVVRSISGGGAELFQCGIQGLDTSEIAPLDEPFGVWLVRQSGGAGMVTMRDQSSKGPMTGDDFRYWSLWSETRIISESPLAGALRENGRGKRMAALAVMLTGNDDAAIVPARTKDSTKVAKGGVEALEAALKRMTDSLQAANVGKVDAKNSIAKIDAALAQMTEQQERRAKSLREIRVSIGVHASTLSKADSKLRYSRETLSRFKLLDEKYQNDLERLEALDEGVSLFETLEQVPCPLCGAAMHDEPEAGAATVSTELQRRAIEAEVRKIRQLRNGLAVAIAEEGHRFDSFSTQVSTARATLAAVEDMEKKALENTHSDFLHDPSELAIHRTEMASVLRTFADIEHLNTEISRLKNLTKRERAPIARDVTLGGEDVSSKVVDILDEWGLSGMGEVFFDDTTYDFKVGGRLRTSFGKGVRGIIGSAISIAVMELALKEGHPHLGVAVVDSPLKAYADSKSSDDNTVPTKTVLDKMYGWLADWSGPGQIVIIENGEVPLDLCSALSVTQFYGTAPGGRKGFYPAPAV